MTMVRQSLIAAAALASAAAFAHDTRPIDEHRPLNADAKVAVSNVAGDVDVVAWDKNELHLTGELSEEVEELRITGDANDLRIEVKLPKETRHTGRTRLKLNVPAGVNLRAESVSADVTVSGIKGPVAAKSVSGDVMVDVGSAKVSADSVSGDVRVRAPSTVTHAQSVSGDIQLRGPSGKIEAETVSGDIAVDAGKVANLSMKTVSGQLTAALELTADGQLDGQSMSGGIRITLPASTAAAVRLDSFSGDCSSDFGKLDGEEGQTRTQTIGAGKGRITLGSFSGDVELRKR